MSIQSPSMRCTPLCVELSGCQEVPDASRVTVCDPSAPIIIRSIGSPLASKTAMRASAPSARLRCQFLSFTKHAIIHANPAGVRLRLEFPLTPAMEKMMALCGASRVLKGLLMAVTVAAGILAGPAFGHAKLLSTLPPADAQLQATPKSLTLTFNENLRLRVLTLP